jgi:predicted transcriptional regulator
MKTTVGVADFAAVMNRSLDRANRRTRGERVRPERRILFERPEDMVAFMTPHRIRLYREVKERPLSVTDLAKALDRNRSAVSRDVKALRERRLIKLTKTANPGHGQVTLVSARSKHIELRASL